ncbi:hypothetical protein LAZ67_6003028 [Cordylochernes scorpioides]|uniref:Mos1 transposase HTH domain-containing protein n=1 Tax=Cordylochernes scorpioides TaxID=51811 RepID=A0ABY6KKV8_9ARAC|nr:hypothetical protein LAZ67_6003028 [Cordylochernes scorpioides]
MNNIIEATILNGKYQGGHVLLPRIPMIPMDTPFEFKRLQFPVRLAFAMTIKKAQGQSGTIEIRLKYCLISQMKKHVLKEDKKQESSKMETNEIGAVIKYICKKRMSPKKIYEDMVDTLREDAPSYTTVKKWVAAFKLGRIITEDEHRPVDLLKTLGIPETTVDRNERTLGPQEAFCPLGSQTFDIRSKVVRRKLSLDNLALFEANPEEFVTRFVTMDETWAQHFAPESKQQSMQWRTLRFLSPQES